MAQARATLAQRGERCGEVLAEALGGGAGDAERAGPFEAQAKRKTGPGHYSGSGRVTRFVRDTWMPIWFPDGAMFAYMFSHEAHHRGQILLLAHQLGYRLPAKIMGGI